jgi:hypothetical protein
VSLGNGVQQAVVFGELLPPDPVLADSFESGVLGPSWTISSNTNGRVQVTDTYGAADGSYALLLDSGTTITTKAEAIWTVDLSGLADATLLFDFAEWNDTETSLPSLYNGSAFGDGVSISTDGVGWRRILNAQSSPEGAWQPFSYNIPSQYLVPGLQIKFQQVGAGSLLPSGGRGYDNIRISDNQLPASPPDLYKVSLAQGEPLGVTVYGGDQRDSIELLGPGGVVLTRGAGNWRDANGVIAGFVAPTTGDYFIRMTESPGPYTLIATRGARYSPDPTSFNALIDLGPGGATVGAIDPTSGDTDAYVFEVNAGDVLSLWTDTPDFGASAPGNTLDTFLELFDPAVQLVASTGVGGGGLNALLSHTALSTGRYLVRVSSELSTTGGYVLRVSGSTGAAPILSVLSSDPFDGRVLKSTPAQLTVNFNEFIRLDTLDPGDLTINGVPAVSVTAIDNDTAVFDLPGLADGLHSVVIEAGAVLSLAGVPLEAFASRFTLDTVAPRVIASSLQPGDVIGPGDLTVTIQFDEELDQLNLTASDVRLSRTDRFDQVQPSSLAYNPVDSILVLRFDAIEEGPYEFILIDNVFDLAFNALDGELPAGPVPPNVSGDGVPGGDYIVAFEVDRVSPAPPVALQTTPLFGSLAAASFRNTGLVLDAGDTDPFAVYMQTGQVLSALLRPVGPDRSDPPGSVLSLSVPGVTAISPGADQPITLSYTHTGPEGQVELVVGNSVFSRGTEYSLDIYLNAALEDTLTQATSTAVPALDLGPAFVGVPGSGVDVANVVGTGQVSKTLQAFGNVISNNRLTFDFTNMPMPLGDGTLTLTALADLGSRQETLTVIAGSSGIALAFFGGGSELSPVTEVIPVDQALLTGLWVDGVISFEVRPSFAVEDLGHNELTLGLAYPGLVIDPVDTYAVDLQAGQTLSVVVESAPGNFVVEIVDAVTGDVLVQPGAGDGYDVLLQGWAAPSAGTYLLKVTSQEDAEYRLGVMRGAVWNTDPGGLGNDPLPLPDNTDTALGYLQTPGAPRLFAMTGQVFFPFLTPSIIELDPVTVQPINRFTAGGTPGAIPGGVNALAYAGGALYAGALPSDNVPPGPGAIYTLDPDSGAMVSSFSTDQIGVDRAHLLAAFGNELVVQDSGGDLVFIDPTGVTVTRRVSPPGIGYAEVIAGAADRGSLFLADFASAGVTPILEIDAFSGALINSYSILQGRVDSMAYIDGRLYAYDTVSDLVTIYHPDTGTLTGSGSLEALTVAGIGGDGVSSAQDADQYTLDLRPGQQVTLRTTTPFDHPAAVPLNSLDPVVRVLGPDGVEAASDDNSAADGKNALLTFTAVAGGVYTVEVLAAGGVGGYLLNIDRAPFLFGDLTGDGFVGIADLNLVLGNWNTSVPIGDLTRGDASGDGFIGIEDLNAVLGNWNATLTPPVVQGDLTGDGFVGIQDLNLVLGNWNTDGSADTRSDPTGDGFVGIADLNLVLTNWNAGTPPASDTATTFLQRAAIREPVEPTAAEAPALPVSRSATHKDASAVDTAAGTDDRRGYKPIHRPASVNPAAQTALAAWSHRQGAGRAAGFETRPSPWSLRQETPATLLGLWEDTENFSKSY